MKKAGTYIFYIFEIYITAIWYILWPFGSLMAILYNFPVLEYFFNKNLATLVTIKL
jgi:hypothetical protein